MITNYDRINVLRLRSGDNNGYLCSMCGQYTTLDESVSHEGYNLVCRRCEFKMGNILGIDNTLSRIHLVGKDRQLACDTKSLLNSFYGSYLDTDNVMKGADNES